MIAVEFFSFFVTTIISFFVFLVGVPIVLSLMKFFGLYVIVEERESKVFVLFGKIIGQIEEPGFYFLPSIFGVQAFMVHFLGTVHTIDRRLDQSYLRSLPVNAEEGAPMGVGVWYEMSVCDPVAFLYKNTDPYGSLRANVSNSTVRCLNNMKLNDLLIDRHSMSKAVREEVSSKSIEWGFKLGSVYIRKVHFRDTQMIRQIEEKVVNRLKQVTSAIKQDGANQVAIIRSSAERQAAVEFARASAMRPYIVGSALQRISMNPEVCAAMFEILENQKMLEGNVDITLIPENLRNDLLAMLHAQQAHQAFVQVSHDPYAQQHQGYDHHGQSAH